MITVDLIEGRDNMTTNPLLRLIANVLSRLIGVVLLGTTFLWGCAKAPAFEQPGLPHFASSDYLNFTLIYPMTEQETKDGAITIKWTKDGFPILHHPLWKEADASYQALSWMDWNATATEWQFRVFDQKGQLIPDCKTDWSSPDQNGEGSLTCKGVLNNNNEYVILQLDYVLHGKHGQGARYLTNSHSLALLPYKK